MITRTIILVCALALTASAAAGGPVLDDILNYMYRDQTTPINTKYQTFLAQNAMSLTKDAPIGQTFVTGPETTRIVRIRCAMNPDKDWQKGEGAEMVLWDSPAKRTALGRYTVWYEFRGFQFGNIEWEVNADVKPNTTYYFEISYAGEGDGKLSWIALMNGRDSYPSGQGCAAGKEADFDVCFQTHVKRAPDRVGNLKKMFARFELDLPQLYEVKQAVDKEDFETAKARLVAYFEARREPVPIINAETAPNLDPKFDLTSSELAMTNYFQSSEMGKGYAGPDINWRAEPDFNPDGTIAASGWNTAMNRFGPRGPLTTGYLASGDNKYIKKLNEVLIDFYLDNPPPGVSQIGGDGSEPVWATLDCGIRLAANFIAYDRMHTSPEFTLDGRMAYLLNMADDADTLVLNGAGDGGNWAFLSNAALFDFSLSFPEYANAEQWRDAAAERLAIAIKRDILPDGVESEVAPGYQRMSYGPLKDVYNLVTDRGAQLPFGSELKDTLAKQAEYFMYIMMPNGVTPFLGDWGNTQERPPLRDDSKMLDRPDMLYVASAGKEGTKPKELSKLYPYAGIMTMRSDWGDAGRAYEDARYLFLHGVRHGSHGHADLNEITAYAYGRELLADPGSYIYGSLEHDLLCKAVSHNTLVMDGENQSWRCQAGLRNWATTPMFDYISSWAASYKAGNHNREVVYVRANGDPGAGDYWVVRDTAEGTGKHSLEQRWHLISGPAKLDPKSLVARTAFDTGGNLSIIQVNPSRLTVEQTTSDTWMPRGATGEAQKMPTMVYKLEAEFPAAFDTVLFPFKGNLPPQIRIKPLENSPNGLTSAFKVVQGNVQDLFVYQPTARNKALASEKVRFEGERLFLRRVNGKLRSALLVNGKNLSVDGKQVLKSAKPLSWVAVTFDKSGVNAYTSSQEPTLTVPAAKGLKLTVTNTNTDTLIKDVRAP